MAAPVDTGRCTTETVDTDPTLTGDHANRVTG